MRRLGLAAILSSWSAVCLAHTIGRLADVAIIDRESGTRLSMHYWHGEYWVAGEPGARYAIYVRNRLAERLLTVPSVDGINAVTGETAGWNQSGYVLDPEEDYQITGWRKSDFDVAAFAFTAPANSYAERTGRPDNIGVIGLALFRERQSVSPPIARKTPAPAPGEAASARSLPEGSPLSESAQSGDASGVQAGVNRPLGVQSQAPAREAVAPGLGTAHGDPEASYVGHTTFARLHEHPDEIIRIRYDRCENLVAMGVIRGPECLAFREPNAFPGSQGYVPDPPP